MGKYKTTRKAMRESYKNIISVGYCDLQDLLRFQTPFAYSTRAEGWACDYYDIDGVLISTGYSPINSKYTKSTYDICRKYNKAAKKILDKPCSAKYFQRTYKKREKKVNNLLMEYIKEVCR